MSIRATFDRRKFLQLAGSTTAYGVAGGFAPWLHAEDRNLPRFAYVATSGHSEEGIHVFDSRWNLVQTVSSRKPVFLVLHPSQKYLYAVNEIEQHDYLPAGTVEAYGIDAHSGHLTLLNRPRLSLSATLPSHMAVSPDGKYLVVAAQGGGSYNVLPIAADGSLQVISGILKETGSERDISRPQHVMFDGSGRYVLASDRGSDRISVFALEDGKLSRTSRTDASTGNGSRQMAFHPSSQALYIAHDGILVACQYDAQNGSIVKELHRVSVEKGEGSLMAHPSGHFLYHASNKLTAWRTDASGRLTPIRMPSGKLPSGVMTMSADGSRLYVLDSENGNIASLSVHPRSGQLSEPVVLATATSPRSMVMKYA